VRRYQGEKLPPGSRVAVISNDALGNFVVATSLLQLLRQELQPSQLDYYGGYRTWEFQRASDLFDWSFPFHGSAPSEQAQVASERRGYDLVVNMEQGSEAKNFAERLSRECTFVCGPCADMPGHDLPFPNDERGRLWLDQDWTAKDLTSKYPFLQSGFIGEIFCRLSYLHGAVPPYRVSTESAGADLPPVLISTAASLPEKLWPTCNWLRILDFFATLGLDVGLIGAHPTQQKQFWKGNEEEQEMIDSGVLQDFRGRFSLPQVAGALASAKLVLTIDNGILHLAAAAQTPTVGLFREGIHRLWAPPAPNLTVLTPPAGKQVRDIPVEAVYDAVQRAI
jgi:heptosyltransferase-3